jgi:hypothetical protein
MMWIETHMPEESRRHNIFIEHLVRLYCYALRLRV